MNWDNLPDGIEGDRIKALMNSLITRVYYRGNKPDDKKLDFIINKFKESNIEMGKRDLTSFMQIQAEILEDRSLVFHPEKGAISNFAINNQPISVIVTSSNITRSIERVIEQINKVGVSSLNLTQNAITDKVNILRILKESSKNTLIMGDEKPFSESEIEIIKQLIKKLNVDDNVDYKLKVSEWTTLKQIANTLIEADALDLQTREKYYNYWKNIHSNFDDFVAYFEHLYPLLEQLVNTSPNMEINIDISDKRTSTQRELADALEDIILPNYVIKMSPVSKEELTDENKWMQLVYNYLRYLRKQIPLSLDKFKRIEDAEALAGSTVREENTFTEDGKIDESSKGQSIDEVAVGEAQAAIQEAEKEIERENIYVDPLFLLVTYNNKISQNYSDTILDKAKEEIKKHFDLSNVGEVLEELTEIIDGEIDLYINKYKKSQVSLGEEFYISLMDGDEIINLFERSAINVTIEYVDSKGTHEKKFDSYKEAIKWVNKNTKTFFKVLGDIIKVTRGSMPISTRVVDPAGRGIGMGDTNQYWYGGESLPLPLKLSEHDAERLQDLGELSNIIKEYYMKPLSSDMVLLGDIPEFYHSSQFRDFPSIISGTRKQKVSKALKQGYTPFVNSRDYEKVMNWLDIFKDVDRLYLSDKLIETFEDALESFVNFWAIIATVAEKGEAPISEITNEVTVVFGDMLYEIAKDSFGNNEEKMKLYKWKRKPLSYWNTQQQEKNYTIANLLGLLEDPDWKTFIEDKMAKDKKLRRKHHSLIGMLKKPIMKFTGPITNAMLQATDMLRKMQGQKVYNYQLDINDVEDLSYVIDIVKEENKIDIYGVDVYNIVKSQSAFNDIADQFGMSTEVIYKIKGMFR